MYRGLLTLFVISVYIFSSIPLVYAEKKWSDVDTNHPYIAGIDALKEKDILSGFDDGTFKPEDFLTRTQALKIILKSLKIGLPENVTLEDLPFPDIKDNWYLPYIKYAVAYNIMEGYEDGTFHPDSPMTRAEFSKVLLTAKDIRPKREETPFEDVNQNDWFSRYVSYLFKKGILPEDLGAQFKPQEYITRALGAQIVFNTYFNTEENNEEIEDRVEEDVPEEEREENTEEDVPEETDIDENIQINLSERGLDEGVASYYHDKFNGQHTANGEIFDNNGLTAAHPYLPMGSIVRVMNVENEKLVEVRINDCGPFSKDRHRVIDLTKTAFETIGNISAGLIDVRVEIVSIPEGGKFRDYCYEITSQ